MTIATVVNTLNILFNNRQDVASITNKIRKATPELSSKLDVLKSEVSSLEKLVKSDAKKSALKDRHSIKGSWLQIVWTPERDNPDPDKLRDLCLRLGATNEQLNTCTKYKAGSWSIRRGGTK